ncbi:MAG: restriction endonuclease subunit S [Balneolaceae bacterium]|nr:restriction endonuclease subunit S [Balneolaceae bacterium]
MNLNWDLIELGDICELVTKGTTPTSIGHKYTDDGINFIKIESIDSNGSFKTEKFAHIDEAANEALKRSQLKKGDILFSIAGALGRAAIVTEDVLPANTNQALAIIRLKKEAPIMREYLFSALSTGFSLEQIENFRGGVAQQNLSLTQIKSFKIPIPPLPEQKRIVAILHEAFEVIDQAKANIERNIQNAEELFQSKLNEVFSQSAEESEEKRLDEVCENLDRFRKPITKKDREEGPYPYYGASGIVDYVADYIFDEDLLLVSEDGANLLARTYPIAFSISGKNWVNNHAHVLRFDNLTSQRFIEYYLNSIKLDPWVSGMAQPKLNQRNLNSIPVPFPALQKQQKIVDELDELQNDIESIIEAYKQKESALEELKKSILHEAFSGELTASEPGFSGFEDEQDGYVNMAVEEGV